MPNPIFLKMGKAEYATGQNRPQLILLKSPLLLSSLSYLRLERPLPKLKKRIHFIESGTVLIFGLTGHPLQIAQKFTARKLPLFLLHEGEGLVELLPIIEGHLPQKVLLPILLLPQQEQSLGVHPPLHLKIREEVRLPRCPRSHDSNINYKLVTACTSTSPQRGSSDTTAPGRTTARARKIPCSSPTAIIATPR